jgi:exonuclease SbcC
MLSKLFGKRARLEADDPLVRRAVIDELSETESERFQDDLARIAELDAHPPVRCAAIRRLDEPERLKHLLHDTEASVSSAAIERLAELALQMPALLEIPEIRRARIIDAADPADVDELLQRIEAKADLIDLAVEARHAKVRLALARRLVDETSLTELERRTRSRDKTVNRLARTRLDAIRHDQGHHAKALRRAAELLESLRQAAAGEAPSASRLGGLAHSWKTNFERLQELTTSLRKADVRVDSDEPLKRSFDDAFARAQEHAQQHAEQQVEVQKVQEAPTTAAPSTEDFATILSELIELEGSLRSRATDMLANARTLHQRYTDISARWSSASDHNPPPDDVAEQYHQRVHAFTELFEVLDRLVNREAELRRLLELLPTDRAQEISEPTVLWRAQRKGAQAATALDSEVSRMVWPEGLPKPALLADVGNRLATFRTFEEQASERARTLETATGELIVALEQQIEAGNLDAAVSRDAQLRSLLKDLPHEQSRSLRQQAQPLERRLSELKDWRTYATSPKREALLHDMEALIDSGLEPSTQGDRIKALRSSWNALGPVTTRHDRHVFDRFNHAAEQAFEPCRVFYQEQAAQREHNLLQRNGICEALERYLHDTNWTGADWTATDWKSAEQILRTARDEWHRFHPVDRAPGRKLKTRFDALTDQVHEHIKTEWDRNITRKEELIGAAEAVISAETPIQEATNAIKSLQHRWRDVGITPRRVDQRLWKAFRKACDAVFERRDQERTSHRESLDSEADSATALCDEFQAHIDSCAADTVQKATLREFVGRFHQLGELPRDKADVLRRRFGELERSYRSLLSDAAQHAIYAELDRWKELDATLGELEQRARAGETVEPPDVDRFVLTLTDAVLQRLNRVAGQTPGSNAEDESLRRRMAIEAEIAVGFESPETDQQRRLELQVERLNRGMSGQRDLEEDPMELAIVWCSLPGAEPNTNGLRDRFFDALRRLAG